MSIYIIAEAGVNHNGVLDVALRLVDAAADAGADAVKFQTFRAESLVAPSAPKADYQVRTTGESGSQLDMIRSLELSASDHRVLLDRCARRRIDFLSSPFDVESVQLLTSLGLSTIKIPSGAVTDLPYLRAVGALNMNLILSTGMSTLEEVRAAVRELENAGTPRQQIIVLHCTTEYPTAPDHVNLRVMETLASALEVTVGYSDHTEGICVPIAAAALGAAVIEKHLTLDRTMPGPDHQASLEPEAFQKMVCAVRIVERALGSATKCPTDGEMRNAIAARKSIVAARPIHAGEVITARSLTTKRPGTGISPMRWYDVIGTAAVRNFEVDEMIEL